MVKKVLRGVIRELISESEDSSGRGNVTVDYIGWMINAMAERLRNDRMAIVSKVRRKLRDRGALQFDPTPDDLEPAADSTPRHLKTPSWIDFRDRLTDAIVALGPFGYNDVTELVQWASSLKRAAAPVSALPPTRQVEPAPASAPFERYAFASQRRDFPTERDNDLEKRIVKLIRRHIHDNIPLPAQYFDLMMDLTNQGLYGDILRKPDPDALIYRGMHVHNSFIESLGLDPETIADGDHYLDVVINPATSRHKAYVSSWTYSREVADVFKSTGGNAGFSVVLIARAGDNPDSFLDCEIFAEEIASIGAEAIESSEEVLCGGSVRLSGVEITRNSD